MQPVFGLVKDNRVLRLKDVIGYFHAVQPELLVDLLPNFGLTIMECRQAVQELDLRPAGFLDLSNLTRSSHTESGSPIETHTSV